MVTPPDPGAASVWVLLGARHGDNQQLLAIADALGVPYRTVPLRFNVAAGLPPVLLGASRLSWGRKDPAALQPPWPRVVLAAGRKSVPAARWIRRQSGGRTRLVHINRPWAPLSWFDLIVTAPQYAVPERPNVLSHRMPFMPPPVLIDVPLPRALQAQAARLPRPWTLVMVGGDSRPFVLDDEAAVGLARLVNAQVRAQGGSAWVLGSPRTPATAMDVLARTLDVPVHVVRWGEGENPYAALRQRADRLVVTTDSASMLTEALLTGKPVVPFALPRQPDWRWRLATAWRAAAARRPGSMVARSFDALQDLGLLSSLRDLGLLHRALEAAGAFDGRGRVLDIARQEREATLARIRALIDRR
ncbi:mitochondrial fission ELM1 family protein [Variovorax arabinosiphilus]|uniref:mitochondrial fission ELM1 family protein n=1 Tax=Variovorax arabinosiphilus TaxID=3053498 RepID=UPI0025768FDD|nr:MULTISPECIES: ELM1/GtrOC1 family putative glycosyltransferase [unclassified Variovorax]MDM0119649.1 ELM1/GtrOC1 family putative glycosyltransferase [Variovorax sp. J2L1-78]MDM0128439.1 ELM1/GtrOC1 family putative glycosyltransferase [Variovorax sp. J2L1-63]MDM0232139.1 ELM1/GtrOC1 family putative glycosyltransferase [Variovorax sp. J2R1-6]